MYVSVWIIQVSLSVLTPSTVEWYSIICVCKCYKLYAYSLRKTYTTHIHEWSLLTSVISTIYTGVVSGLVVTLKICQLKTNSRLL